MCTCMYKIIILGGGGDLKSTLCWSNIVSSKFNSKTPIDFSGIKDRPTLSTLENPIFSLLPLLFSN